MKVGANETCPCGSGVKYKRCCRNKSSNWEQNINTILRNEGFDDVRIANGFLAMLVLLQYTKWNGACHGASAMLYVLFNELGYETKLCSGVISCDMWVSGHSWIELNDKVFDVACYFPRSGRHNLSPVFFGLCIDDMNPTETLYGIANAPPVVDVCEMIYNEKATVTRLMNAQYDELQGASLWQALDNVCVIAGIDILTITNEQLDTRELEQKYRNVRSELKDSILTPDRFYIDTGNP